MSFSIKIFQDAENDIREAFLWYENKKVGLGSIFEKFISDAIESIGNNPYRTQVKYNNTRIFFLKKFPYGIHFRVTENTVSIIAVFHTSRNPDIWKDR